MLKKWTESKTIQYIAAAWLGQVLLQLVPMLQAHKIDWWALGASSITALVAILTRMSASDIIAPVAVLNRNNADGPLSGPRP